MLVDTLLCFNKAMSPYRTADSKTPDTVSLNIIVINNV
jgi:hypothetical protein